MNFFFMLTRVYFLYGIRVYMQDVWEGYFPIPVIKLKETVTIMNKEINASIYLFNCFESLIVNF